MASDKKSMPLAITGIGMVTPVGLDAPTSCASVRNGTARLEQLHEFPYIEFFRYDSNIVEVVGSRVRGLTDGHLGFSRFSRMAVPAFAEAIGAAQLDLKNHTRISFIIALPDIKRPGRDERLEQLLLGRILKAYGVTPQEVRTLYIYSGHASACVGLYMARDMLAKGEVDHVVVCGVETLIEPVTLIWLEKTGRLKNDDNPDGFNPGEAAFCIVVEKAETAKRRGTDIQAYLKGLAIFEESNTALSGKPPTGIGLSKAFKKTLLSLSDEGTIKPVNMVVCDLNGERYRATEWGNAAVRSLSRIAGTFSLWHPADCIGDTGVASAGISVIIAATAVRKGYADGNCALVWASSDEGIRGSLIVEEGC